MPNLAHVPEFVRELPTEPVLEPQGDGISMAHLERYMRDQTWRLNNLYKIINKNIETVPFNLNWAQKVVWDRLHYNGVILKARQLGMSTFIEIVLLDLCLFRSNFVAMVIAHGREEASSLFQQKILFAYNNLPDALRQRVPAVSMSKTGIRFNNGSEIRVATSARSGTINALHISEFGKICAKYPMRADEIVSGSLPAVPKGDMPGLVLVESTAEGHAGHFYDMVSRSKALALGGKRLTKSDYRFFFFPWHLEPTYRATAEDAAATPIPTRLTQYFAKLESDWGVTLDQRQRAWYANEEQVLGSMLRREHPSFADEAFSADVEGSYYGKQIDLARMEGRVTSVPVQPGVPVQTWWDLGYHDYCVVLLVQTIGGRIHVVDYIMDHGYGVGHYCQELKKLQEKGRFFWGEHIAPHDGANHDIGSGKSRKDIAYENGFKWTIVPRPTAGIQNGIDRVRLLLDVMHFDEERCGTVVDFMGAYRKEWDANLGSYKDKPRHDDSSHVADAFRVGCTKHPLAAKMTHRTTVDPSNHLVTNGRELPTPRLNTVPQGSGAIWTPPRARTR